MRDILTQLNNKQNYNLIINTLINQLKKTPTNPINSPTIGFDKSCDNEIGGDLILPSLSTKMKRVF